MAKQMWTNKSVNIWQITAGNLQQMQKIMAIIYLWQKTFLVKSFYHNDGLMLSSK